MKNEKIEQRIKINSDRIKGLLSQIKNKADDLMENPEEIRINDIHVLLNWTRDLLEYRTVIDTINTIKKF